MGKGNSQELNDQLQILKWSIWGLLGVMSIMLIVLILFYNAKESISLPVDSELSDSVRREFEMTGTIGDSINGILTPFIGSIAVLTTFLAFYVQFVANQSQRNDIHRERFESKFYEMLRAHNSNVSEMEIRNSRHQLKGRKLLLRMFFEFKFIYQVVSESSEAHFKDQFVEADLTRFSYLIFFHGVDIDVKRTFNPRMDPSTTELFTIVKDHLANKVRVDYRDRIRDTVNSDDPIGKLPSQEEEDPNGFKMLYYPFDGHLSRLPHYYRHLFQMVCFIIEEEDLEYKEKYRYLKMLRAQLSNFEQLLLYYNSFVYGKPWQDKKLFSEFKFIKNLPLVHADFGIKPHDLLGVLNSRNEYIFEDDEYEAENK